MSFSITLNKCVSHHGIYINKLWTYQIPAPPFLFCALSTNIVTILQRISQHIDIILNDLSQNIDTMLQCVFKKYRHQTSAQTKYFWANPKILTSLPYPKTSTLCSNAKSYTYHWYEPNIFWVPSFLLSSSLFWWWPLIKIGGYYRPSHFTPFLPVPQLSLEGVFVVIYIKLDIPKKIHLLYAYHVHEREKWM